MKYFFYIALFFLLMSGCSREEKPLSPTPQTVKFLGRLPLTVEDRTADCPPFFNEEGGEGCQVAVYDIGWGDTVRLLWLEYRSTVEAWRQQLAKMEEYTFSVDRYRLMLQLPSQMVLSQEALHSLRAQWPSGSTDGGPLLSRFPIREADRNSEGLLSQQLLGVKIEGEWVCRSYRNRKLTWCWSLDKIDPESFAKWRLHLPFQEAGENEWALVRDGRLTRVVERNGHVGLITGVLPPDSLSKILRNFLSLQAWTK